MTLDKYSQKEERINVITHAFGFVLSVVGLVFLVLKVNTNTAKTLDLVSVVIFGLSMTILYAASTTYHSAKTAKLRKRLNVFDHASIYVLIAGTYTPFSLISLIDSVGWTLIIVIWSIALIGVVLKLFFTGKYDKLSTLMYVLMGWIIIGVLKPLIASVDINGLMWLLAGGVFYSVGAVFYITNKFKMNHAIFHVFVLLGSASHYISIYKYVL